VPTGRRISPTVVLNAETVWRAAQISRLDPAWFRSFGTPDCPLELVDRCLTWAAGESAGQCGPCLFGLPALATDWRALAAGGDQAAYDRVRSRVGLLPGRGACRFPDGVAGLAGSALRVLADHLEQHRAGRCDAAELRTTSRRTDVHAH